MKHKIFKEILIGIPIALIAMLVTYTFLYQMDEEFQSSQSMRGKGGNLYCSEAKPMFCKSKIDRHECCTHEEFINQYWGEFIALPAKNGPDFLLVIVLGIGSAIIFNLAIDHFNKES